MPWQVGLSPVLPSGSVPAAVLAALHPPPAADAVGRLCCLGPHLGRRAQKHRRWSPACRRPATAPQPGACQVLGTPGLIFSVLKLLAVLLPLGVPRMLSCFELVWCAGGRRRRMLHTGLLPWQSPRSWRRMRPQPPSSSNVPSRWQS